MISRYCGSRCPSVGAPRARSTRLGTVLGPGPMRMRSTGFVCGAVVIGEEKRSEGGGEKENATPARAWVRVPHDGTRTIAFASVKFDAGGKHRIHEMMSCAPVVN